MLWFLSHDRLSELLEIRKEECLRKVYQFKSAKPQMTLSGGFHEVDGDLLIDFLAWSLELDEVAEEFLRGGIFLANARYMNFANPIKPSSKKQSLIINWIENSCYF